MTLPDIEVSDVFGVPSVHLNDPMSEQSIAAVQALVDELGGDSVIDGDHDTVMFDPSRVTVPAIMSILTPLDVLVADRTQEGG